MPDTWPCITCPARDSRICGALLGQDLTESGSGTGPSWQEFRTVRPNERILARGEPSEYFYVLCEGWAFRFLQLSDGRRQILQFVLPGEPFSAGALFTEELHFSAQALTEARFSRFNREEVRKRVCTNPAVMTAFAESCVEEDIAAGELLLALGRLSAEERIAYVFVHLMNRTASTNVVKGHRRYLFPLRQQHIAAVTGLTAVHVSRVLTMFRDRGICQLSGGVLEVMDPAELERIGSMT